jgi:alpha-tubulin suppressor-like RCC1 family protein
VKCWGWNLYGQLGNGLTTDSTTPVDVTGLTSGVASVAVGIVHTCAVTTGGGVKCWGQNVDGQLGNGTLVDSNMAVDVTGLTSGVAAVSAGGGHTCALTTGSGVKCWGGNGDGQLGDGTFTGSSTPVDTIGLASGVATVSAGGRHSCAISSGGAQCWGFNLYGQLGNGFTTNASNPVAVTGLTSGVAAVSVAGLHTCALTLSGGAKCWGNNLNGQLGNGTTTNSSPAVNVTSMTSGVSAVSAGGFHTCAITTSAGAMCWGDNAYGQLGNGTTTDSSLPVVASLKGPSDTDGDGCPDAKEQQMAAGTELSGGRRDYFNPDDYYNPSHDGVNRVDDILLVVQAYFDDDDDGNPGLPPYEPGYAPDFDRTYVGPLAWNLGPPNGLQRVDDILNQVKQYYNDCS